MIVPLVGEEGWLEALSDLPEWRPPMQRTVVLSPHPDDETLSCGGLIANLRSREVPVTVVAATDGENCYESEHLGSIRSEEQTAAVRRLGVEEEELRRLSLTDSNLIAQQDEMFERLLPHITPETHLLAPWTGDFHPDHEACASVAQLVAAAMHLPLTYYFFWTWHRGSPALLEGLPLRRFSLTHSERNAKREALLCHRSQLSHSSGAPILPENLLGPARREYEVFLPA